MDPTAANVGGVKKSGSRMTRYAALSSLQRNLNQKHLSLLVNLRWDFERSWSPAGWILVSWHPL